MLRGVLLKELFISHITGLYSEAIREILIAAKEAKDHQGPGAARFARHVDAVEIYYETAS